MAAEDYQVIIPLGLLSPPEHVTPTTHIYYHLNRDTSDGGHGYDRPPLEVDIRAPGNVRVLGINSSTSWVNGVLSYVDYDVIFAPCRDQMYELIHVSTLNPELTALYEAATPSRCDEYGPAEARYRYCKSTLELEMTVGTVIGTTGGKLSAALDLEAYDLAAKPLAFANPDRYISDLDLRLKIMCPFDGFTPEARVEQMSRIGGYDGQPRTEEPLCGEVMQDVPGTAQGNWFTGSFGGPVDWSKELSLVHDYIDPTNSAISVGGTIMESGLWLFDSKNTGPVNRDFAQVVPDSQVHCYQGGVSTQGGQTPTIFPGRLLISLTSGTEMLVEHQGGDCSELPVFVDPVTYKR